SSMTRGPASTTTAWASGWSRQGAESEDPLECAIDESLSAAAPRDGRSVPSQHELRNRMDGGPAMFTLRCTEKLLRRLHAEATDPPPRSTTVLGDWYATVIVTRPSHLVLGASERTLLPVVLVAAPSSTLVHRFREAVAGVVGALGVRSAAAAREIAEMGMMG